MSSDEDATFKKLPGYENRHTPRSDYLFDLFERDLALLYASAKSFERNFDDFEFFFALAHAHVYKRVLHRAWGPTGRFVWKYRRSHASPFDTSLAEVRQLGDAWPPLQAGLFDRSPRRFIDLLTEYKTEHTDKLFWH